MASLFLFIHKDSIDDVILNGINLEKYANVNFSYLSSPKKGIISYLNPRDIDSLDKNKFDIIIATVNSQDCFVINKDILNLQLDIPSLEAILPLTDYVYGTFLAPRVAICTNISPDHIQKYSKIRSVPILYDNSAKLYYENKIEDLKVLCENNKIDYNKKLYDTLVQTLYNEDILKEFEYDLTTIYFDEENEDLYF